MGEREEAVEHEYRVPHQLSSVLVVCLDVVQPSLVRGVREVGAALVVCYERCVLLLGVFDKLVGNAVACHTLLEGLVRVHADSLRLHPQLPYDRVVGRAGEQVAVVVEDNTEGHR